MLKIKIEDNGIGIEQNLISKIFEMFYRGSELSDGNGMGLYIAQKAIEKMNGNIYVESLKGFGSEFTVELPLSED